MLNENKKLQESGHVAHLERLEIGGKTLMETLLFELLKQKKMGIHIKTILKTKKQKEQNKTKKTNTKQNKKRNNTRNQTEKES